MAYPTTLDDLDASRGATGQTLNSPNHATHHANEDAIIEALEAKVGIDSSADTSSIDYKLKSASSSNPGHQHTPSNVGLSNVDNTSDATKNSATVTLTNKRITKRTGTAASSATPTINTDNVDFYSLTAQTEAITSFTTNLSGTPTEAQTLWIAITGTAARAITWGTSFEASTVALPTTTVTTNRLDCGFVWNTTTSKWRCVATC